jgi:tetratricopeptide (TPR) repeat protein
VDIKKVSRELGIRYVLEGSVRKAGEKVRINAQLIDAKTGGHLWAERYDGQIDDVFKLQDSVTKKIVSALAVKLTEHEHEQLETKDTDSIEAYDEFLKAWSHFLRFTPVDFSKAISHFEKAIELDPNYGRAYAGLARVYERSSVYVWNVQMGLGYMQIRMKARQYLEMAMKKGPTSLAHQVAAQFYLFRHQNEEALVQAQSALTLNPNDPSCYSVMGLALMYAGRLKEAVDFIERGMRLDPQNPALYLYISGQIHIFMGKYERAISLIERALRHNPSADMWRESLAVAYAHLGREKEANENIEALPYPCNTGDQMLFRPHKNIQFAELFLDGLLKAGCTKGPDGYHVLFESNKLNGKEIRELLSDPNVSISGIYSVDTEPWIEGDVLCYQGSGSQICGPIFRNPLDKSNIIQEYLYINDIWIYPFYIVG